ncbi:TPA: hypothetical protein PXO92_003460 [Yersinia enterocolitica]|nr:hypothetical protein [Yersinia enterocolitica]
MLNYAPSITNFFLEQYNYNISIEGSKANNTLSGSLIIDSNDFLSGKPYELRKNIIEFISLKKDDVGFSAVELITLVNGGVSDELLYSVAKGEVTASDAYLIHVFKVRKNEIKAICNKLRNKELSSEDIFRYARGVRQDGNAQPDINNKLASSVQNTLSGDVESEKGISRINVGTNISESRPALDRQESQIDKGITESFILSLNLSKKTSDVIFDKMNIEGLFQNVRLDVLFQQAYVETQNSVIDKNIVEKRTKREIGENTEQQFIGGGMIMTSPKVCQENQTFDECLDMFNNKNEIVKLVDKAVNEAEGKYKLVANNINSTVISSQKSNISSEGNFSPLTYLMSSILENSEMLCSYNSPTNSNAWASLGDMLAVS